MDSFSLYVVAVAIIIVTGIIYEIFKDRNRTKRKLAESTASPEHLSMIRTNADNSQQIEAHLKEINQRIARIEKVLTEIP